VKILVVDDSPENLQLASEVIQLSGHEPVTASDGYRALDILTHEPIQIAIIDWMMPEMNGIELIRRIRAQFSERYMYLMMLTTFGEADQVAEGLESGADDYMVKPFTPRELRARINTGVRIIEMESRLTANLKRFQSLATRDHLTQAYNRRHFLELAQTRYNTEGASQAACALLMLDIDHFKQVNDTYGHLAGDETLRVITRLLGETLPQSALYARYGGEEFIALTEAATPAEALAYAQQLCQRIAQTLIQYQTPLYELHEFHVTVSIGVVYIRNLATQPLEALIAAADAALYRAKAAGRNRVEMA
jgi:diguanylate cyclase (GGDEF)-like protein